MKQANADWLNRAVRADWLIMFTVER